MILNGVWFTTGPGAVITLHNNLLVSNVNFPQINFVTILDNSLLIDQCKFPTKFVTTFHN